jgi:hypothetical protein
MSPTIAGAPLTARNVRNLAGIAASAMWPPNAAVIAANRATLRRERPWLNYIEEHSGEILTHVEAGLNWIRHSQDTVGSGGVGDFRMQGWTPGYPEVTGYIIPTLYDFRTELDDEDLAIRARRMADWELGIQKSGGGFESWYEGEGRPPVVFNTGQVIRGLVRTAQETGEDRFLDAARRAGDWIGSMQSADGSFSKGNYLGMRRVYDVYATAGLAQLAKATGDSRYAGYATANAEFAVTNQNGAGWFELCDNTPEGNATPSTHTLCYTADGLIEIGMLLDVPEFVRAGELAGLAMLEQVEPGGRLPGRFDASWQPVADYVVLTGSAQLGAILTGIHDRAEGERPRLLEASSELLDFVAFAQDLNGRGAPRRGGIAGSYPIWGRYVPFKYPSWATKFFLDHALLMLRSRIR